MRKWINSYFNFTKAEFNGILSLFIIILLATALPRIYEWLITDQQSLEEVAELEKLELQGRLEPLKRSQSNNYAAESFKKSAVKHLDLSVFDPNTLDQAGWERRGLSPKQAMAILKYQSKGGKFRKVEDLKKIYTISPERYEKLKPYVQIKDLAVPKPGNSFKKVEYALKEKKVYELNALDTIGLQAVYGIGPAYARRIFKYRERLGGFHQKEQLMEVFGVDSLKFQELAAQVRVDASLLKQININLVELEELKQHPYLTFKQANAIIAYRKQHGNYSSFAALKKVAILPAETVDKLAPYLSF